jgi:RNA-directed DNA polymerase
MNSVLLGHFNYYGIVGNGKKIVGFWREVRRDWKHSLSKRSHKGRITWEKLQEIFQEHPMVKPRIKIDCSQLQKFVRL